MIRKHLETQLRRLVGMEAEEQIPAWVGDFSDVELQGIVSVLGRKRTEREERGDRPKRTRRR